jgi:ATP-binding cassette subfamily C (CFTR/MRP) protein 1
MDWNMANGDSQVVLQAPAAPIPTAYAHPDPVRHQPFCGDLEGWGPLSSLRFDFTPCFLDVWIALAAGWGILVGAGALWYLLYKRTPQPVQKNWHFYAKLVCFPANDRGKIIANGGK